MKDNQLEQRHWSTRRPLDGVSCIQEMTYEYLLDGVCYFATGVVWSTRCPLDVFGMSCIQEMNYEYPPDGVCYLLDVHCALV